MKSAVKEGPEVAKDRAFADYLRTTRTRLHLSQAEVAARMTAAGHKMHQTQIDKIEHGARRLQSGEMELLVAVLAGQQFTTCPTCRGMGLVQREATEP